MFAADSTNEQTNEDDNVNFWSNHGLHSKLGPCFGMAHRDCRSMITFSLKFSTNKIFILRFCTIRLLLTLLSMMVLANNYIYVGQSLFFYDQIFIKIFYKQNIFVNPQYGCADNLAGV